MSTFKIHISYKAGFWEKMIILWASNKIWDFLPEKSKLKGFPQTSEDKIFVPEDKYFLFFIKKYIEIYYSEGAIEDYIETRSFKRFKKMLEDKNKTLRIISLLGSKGRRERIEIKERRTIFDERIFKSKGEKNETI